MSVNSLLYSNNIQLKAGTLELNALASGGIKVSPLNVKSNVLCANLNAQLWNGCQGGDFANLAVGDILVCSNAITRTFERLPIGPDDSVLTANSQVSLGLKWVL